MGGQDRTVEQKLAAIAGRQHGVASRQQLILAGVSERQIDRRLASGGLIRAYRGVYRVGHGAPSMEADYMGAILACGRGAVLSGSAAAYLYSLIKGLPPVPEVTAATERRIAGIVARRSRRMDPRDATTFRRIPTKTVAAVLVDIAATLTATELSRACHEAGVRYRTTPGHVEAALSRRPHTPGAGRLWAVMNGDVRVSLSKLERCFLELLVEAGLVLPVTNKVASGRRVDCRWPEQRLTVELLSYTYHGSRHAWELDHRRAREAYARGDEFRSYTYEDVFVDPRAMLAELSQLIPLQHPA